MKTSLTIDILKAEAKIFCEEQKKVNHVQLIDVTDGKAVGTYVEHAFKAYLDSKYTFSSGNSAKGIDLPGDGIDTDIKVTSISQPQSSCPFKTAAQKIYGLGYNLLVFVYKKEDTLSSCYLDFKHCTFIQRERTADYTLTKRLREMVADGANKEDIISLLSDRAIPGDELIYNELAERILSNPPKQGYLTISNALQWRLQYKRVIELRGQVTGVTNYDW